MKWYVYENVLVAAEFLSLPSFVLPILSPSKILWLSERTFRETLVLPGQQEFHSIFYSNVLLDLSARDFLWYLICVRETKCEEMVNERVMCVLGQLE